jgi:hypothetical protein
MRAPGGLCHGTSAVCCAVARHSCECLCTTCERRGDGYFAQRAVLPGDLTATDRLAPAVFAALRARRVSVGKRGPKASSAGGAKHAGG